MRTFWAATIATATFLLIAAMFYRWHYRTWGGARSDTNLNFNTERNFDARPGHTEFQTEVHL